MHTKQCAENAPLPHLTRYGLPSNSKRQRLDPPIKPEGSFAGRLPDQLLETTQSLKRMLDAIDRARPEELQNIPPRAGRHLLQLSIRLNETAQRLCHTKPPDNPPARTPRRSPNTGSNGECGYKATSQGVVNGIGVVAQRRFYTGDSIAQFSGSIVFRTLNANGRYNVFSVRTNDPIPQVQFHDRDTYTAWSGIHLLHSGSPGIEIGRDGNRDIRYLNHSKNANVQVVSTFVGRMNIYDCSDKLVLTVMALKDIKPGDELVFDYDKSKPDSEIDFSLTTVERPDPERADKILASIIRIYQDSNPFLPPVRTNPAKCSNQSVKIPDDVDVVIDNIMIYCKEITNQSGSPATLDQLMLKLSPSEAKLLDLIVTDAQPDLTRIESLARSICKDTTPDFKVKTPTKPLTLKGVQQLKQYLQDTFFNGKQTWITIKQLKEQLHRKTEGTVTPKNSLRTR